MHGNAEFLAGADFGLVFGFPAGLCFAASRNMNAVVTSPAVALAVATAVSKCSAGMAASCW